VSESDRLSSDVERALGELVRIEGGRILAVLAATTGDLQLAEDAVQDATVAALEVWSRNGIPQNPSGWLYVAARRKLIDVVRRESSRERREGVAQALVDGLQGEPPSESRVRDDVLRLIFTCCHPAIDLDARVALALRTLCGLSTAEVARALLVSEPTMAKRLVRTKHKIVKAAIPYRIPRDDELESRLGGVYAVIHLVYTAGHHAPSGATLRTDLCEEGIRLARLAVDLAPANPTGEAVLALLLLTDARRVTRVDATGALVPLPAQDRTRWSRRSIDEGLARLNTSLGRTNGVADPYQLQAAIAAQHSIASSHETTDWPEIVRLYAILAEVHPNPVVDLNAAVAVAEVEGPEVGLARLDRVDASARSHLWHVGRAEMLFRMGRMSDAASEFMTAYDRAPTEPERQHLMGRLAACGTAGDGCQPIP
jgi:RNA polymerase sigma-70 factor (ECF subfamily)